MPAPAFGFSAGDFVSAIGLVRKISKALKRTGGASTEYQLAIIELKGLENVLRHLESLEPKQNNERHINAIRGMALACQLPLRDFLTKMEKYEASLGPFSSPKWFRGLPQKSKWAVTFAEEVEKMRALVAAKTVSINLLLAMDLSNSLSKMEANLGKQREKEHSELLSKAAEHRSTLDSMEGLITNIGERIQHATQTSDEKLKALSSDVEATKAAVMSFRSIGQQLMTFVTAFPLEMRDLLQKILQSNWQIYHILLSIQQTHTPSPTQSLDSNIQFEDAMGELIPLPYMYFRHWETFEGFLRSHFKGTIGEVKVDEGQYNIINVDKGRATIKKDHWTRSIDQGTRISMSMIMSRLRRAMGKCPRPSCTGSRFAQHHVRTNLLTCELCNLRFYKEAGELEDIFGYVTVQDEEEQVAQKQLEEDLRIYGTRQEPPDAVDLDEDEQLGKSPPKRSASEFEAGVDRPAKARKKSECRTYNYENVTAMDWNAGESPMMAWVNQSAVPAAIPLDTSQTDPPVSKDEELLQREEKEIEIFKNVHVSDALASANNAKFAASLECGSDLDFGAQIYYRNIIDRYPLLPPYLARRLALANHNRAERLQQSRLRTETRVDMIAEAINASPFHTRSISATTEKVADKAPSIPVTMPEEKAAIGSRRRKTLMAKERRLLCEHHEKFPGLKQTELGALFGIERSMVSKILRSKHKYLDQDIGREPLPVDRAQSKISKPLEQLDESTPWSSWSEITAAGSYAMASMQARPQSSPNSPPESGFSSVTPSRPGSPGGSKAGDNNGVPTTCTNCFTQTTPLWRRNPEGHLLCNVCGLYLKLHGVARPLFLKTDVIKKCNRGSSNRLPFGAASTRSSKKASRKNSIHQTPATTPTSGKSHGQNDSASPPSAVPRSPASSNKQRHGSQSNAVDENVHSMQTSAAWMADCSGMSVPKLDRTMSDVYQDELYNPVLPLVRTPQDAIFQDLSISPPMSSPIFPAHVPSSPPRFDTQSERYPIVQQARHQGDSMHNGILINGERYACKACFDEDRVRSCQHIDRHLIHINNDGSGSHRAPSLSGILINGERSRSDQYQQKPMAGSPRTIAIGSKGRVITKAGAGFWTGRRQSHRPSSVQSYGSSRNSSLHGSPAMDPSYQSPAFSTEDQKHGSTEAGNSPRGLFPAPVDWTATQSRDQVSKTISFDCEICGEVVKASRRLDWQIHVMNDLRPYACTAEDCSQPDETYSTVKDYLRHEISSHEVPYPFDPIDVFAKIAGKSITCLFCGQQTTEGRGQHSRGRHVGQHMEEIAFMVVPKAYEDWEFYSEASSGIQTGRHTPYFYDQHRLSSHQSDCQVHRCENTNPSTGKPCNTVFSRAYDLTRHEDIIHDPRKQKVRCQICTEEKTFSRRDALIRHMRVVHPDVDFPT